MRSVQELLRRVRNRLDVDLNYLAWRRDLAPLRDVPRPAIERKVMFCDLMTMAATAKVEALMAGLLRLRGYGTIVLLERPNSAIARIFSAAVPDAEFIVLSQAMAPEQIDVARQRADAILAAQPDLQQLIDLEIDGFRIGRNVLSAVLRQLRVGRLDNEDRAHRDLARKILARSLAVKAFVETMLASYRPAIAIFNERGYTPAGEIFDGCIVNGIDAVQWCGAPQADCLIYRRYDMKTRGEHPLALSDATWRRLQSVPWNEDNDRAVVERIAANYESGAWYNRQKLQEGKAVLSPGVVQGRLALDPSKRTAAIFCHILYDATFFYGESLFTDYEEWLVETVRSAIANPRVNWIVKVHPVNVWRSRMDGAELVQLEAQTLHRAFGTLPDHIKILAADTDINTFSLFDVVDCGLTVRGTIGMELPCFGIPVITAGTGRYSGRGFTNDPKTRKEYVALLARLQDLPKLDEVSVSRARRHYYGALSLRPVQMRSFLLDYDAKSGIGLRPAPDVIMKRRSDERLLSSEDLGRLVHWLADTKEPELLSREIASGLSLTEPALA
jgi:hypothetical protein